MPEVPLLVTVSLGLVTYSIVKVVAKQVGT